MKLSSTGLKVLVVLGALVSVVVVVERLVVTDQEAIEASLDAVREAVLSGDASACMAEVAQDYRFGTMDRDALAPYVATWLTKGKVLTFAWFGRKIQVTEGTAEVRVDIIIKVRMAGRTDTGRILGRVFYAEKDSGWKISGFKRD